jgi:glycosyltransferase involved in cell wall biosynthesis
MKNKIVYIQWANGFGGLEKITSYYENMFLDRNPIVIFFDFREIGFSYKNYIFFDKNQKLTFFFKYLKFVASNKNKILHFQIPEVGLILFAYLIGHRKIVCQFHGCYTPRKKPEKIVWRFLQNNIQIISNSEYTKNEIRKKYSATKNISIIPNYIDENEFLFTKRQLSNEKFVVTYAGRLSKGKNISLLLDIVKILDSYENIEFRIYGDGPEKLNLLSKIEHLNIADKIKIFPFSANIYNIYKDSNLFIFLSLYETFGNTVAEAILTGLPVLCYKIPPLAEFLKDDYFFVENQDAEEIASKIIYIKNNYLETNEKLESVYHFVKLFLNNQNIHNQIENIYKKLDLIK